MAQWQPAIRQPRITARTTLCSESAELRHAAYGRPDAIPTVRCQSTDGACIPRWPLAVCHRCIWQRFVFGWRGPTASAENGSSGTIDRAPDRLRVVGHCAKAVPVEPILISARVEAAVARWLPRHPRE